MSKEAEYYQAKSVLDSPNDYDGRMVTDARNYVRGYEDAEAQLKAKMPSDDNFKVNRKLLGLSLREVEKLTGVSKATISRLERGKEVFYNTVVKLTTFYNGSNNKQNNERSA